MNLIAQKRNPNRTPSFLKAQLIAEFSKQNVLVRDISVNGALLDVAESLRVFEIVTLICGDAKVNGIVAWCEHGRLGMEFSELLTCEVLMDSLENRIRVSAPKKYQPGIA